MSLPFRFRIEFRALFRSISIFGFIVTPFVVGFIIVLVFSARKKGKSVRGSPLRNLLLFALTVFLRSNSMVQLLAVSHLGHLCDLQVLRYGMILNVFFINRHGPVQRLARVTGISDSNLLRQNGFPNVLLLEIEHSDPP